MDFVTTHLNMISGTGKFTLTYEKLVIESNSHDDKRQSHEFYLACLLKRGMKAELCSKTSKLMKKYQIEMQTGIPDIICEMNQKAFFIEIKTKKDMLNMNQLAYIASNCHKYPIRIVILEVERIYKGK